MITWNLSEWVIFLLKTYDCPDHYNTREKAELDIMEYILYFYNTKRIHSAAENKNPYQYEMEYFEKNRVV